MGELVNFIDDDILDRLEMTLHDFPGKNRLESFGCCDEDVGWRRGLLPSIRCRGVPMPHSDGELRGCDETLDAVDHVAVQRTQGCDVEHLDA